jgi:hypothetical protein
MLGDIYEKSERKDLAGNCYAQIVKNYPLSSHAADAKAKLKALSMPVPQPDPKRVEWMTAEQNAPRKHESLVRKPLGILHPGPNVSMAAQNGLPNLQPQGEDQTGVDILKGGNKTTLGGGTGIVATIKPGEAAPAGSTGGTASSEDVNAPSSDPPAADAKESSSSTDSQTSGTSAEGATGTSGTDGSATTDSKTDSSQTATDNSQASNNADQNGKKKESSSKKKGLRKVLPW